MELISTLWKRFPRNSARHRNAIGAPLALEPPVSAASDESVAWTNISWNDSGHMLGRKTISSSCPWSAKQSGLSLAHAVNVTDSLYAQQNRQPPACILSDGQGYAVLENLWGFCMGLTATTPKRFCVYRHRARHGRQSAQRGLGAARRDRARQDGVFTSRFPNNSRLCGLSSTGMNTTLLARNFECLSIAGIHFYDMWHRTELKPLLQGTQAILTFLDRRPRLWGCLSQQKKIRTGTLEKSMDYMEKTVRRQRLVKLF